MSRLTSSARSISPISSALLIARCDTTARHSATEACSSIASARMPSSRSSSRALSARYCGRKWMRRPVRIASLKSRGSLSSGAVSVTPARAARSAMVGCGPRQTMSSTVKSSP